MLEIQIHQKLVIYFSAGSVMTKVDPCPSPADSVQICHPQASMTARAMVEPVPIPPPL
jgi:hypothetical protein